MAVASSLLPTQEPLGLILPPSPRFWPSPESWGGQREEEGETARAVQRVRKPPCCLAAGTTGEWFWQELPAGLRSPWRPGLERVTGSG